MDSPKAGAEAQIPEKKLWNLAALPAYFILETTLHEGSHAAVGKACGLKITAFKPYPHTEPGYWVRDNVTNAPGRRLAGMYWQPGQSYFGSVSFSGRTLTRTEEAIILAAPYMTDTILFLAADLALGGYAVDPKSLAGLILYTAGMVAPFVNFTFNAHNVKEYTDFGRLSELIGKHNFAGQAAFHVGARVMILAAIWRLWIRGREVLFSAAPKKKPSRFTVLPLAGTVNGMGAGFQF